jgi:capsular polysaccharide biosynthesis protein
MSDEDGTVRIPRLTKAGTPVRPWADDTAEVGESPAPSGDAAAGLISLSFLTSALRRRARLWCISAVVGLLLGLALVFHAAPAYQATTSVVVTSAPGDNPLDAILTDQALAESRSVAGRALQKLGLKDSVTHFLSTYNVTSVTDKVLQFTITAPSSDEAVRRVAGLASEFLTFRADQARLNQEQVTQALSTQVSQQKAQVTTLAGQIATLQSQASTPDQKAKLDKLRTSHTQAISTLTSLQSATLGEYASMRIDTSAVVNQSRVLDKAAPVVHSALKRPVEYAGGALVAGLVMGMAFVIIQALLSDRLRRRDDVAYALGTQVRLSVPVVRLRRWLPGRHGLAAARLPAVQRIVSYLRSALPAEAAGGALVVIPADRPEVAALSLAALAVSCAQQGKKVVVADLSPGAHAARLLQSKEPGMRTVTVGDTELILVVPGRGDVVPVGPLSPVPSLPAGADDALLEAYGSADVLLTLAAVDPSSGADHLPTWGPRAVVTVTAGASTTTRIHAVGEIIRLSGTALFSAVLIGADKTDESLGITSVPKAAGPGGDGLLSFGSR